MEFNPPPVFSSQTAGPRAAGNRAQRAVDCEVR
jgi:hypothetical protein